MAAYTAKTRLLSLLLWLANFTGVFHAEKNIGLCVYVWGVGGLAEVGGRLSPGILSTYQL